MNRRDLLRLSLASAALYGASPLPRLSAARAAPAADGFPLLDQRTLVHITLNGGPDLRYLLPPAFNADASSYGYRYWQSMASAHGLADQPSAWEGRWQNSYLPQSNGEFDFGILSNCGWLERMWSDGKLAIICNAFGASTRDHAHGLVVMHRGDHLAQRLDTRYSGWGGRLAMQTDANVLALNKLPLQFAFVPEAEADQPRSNTRLISAPDTRNISLFDSPSDAQRERLVRSLRSYYQSKREQVPTNSVYRRIVDLEQQIREFGEPIDARLANIPVPEAISALYQGDTPTLFNPQFGEQMRNLYDSFACSDILNPRVMSLQYDGFDTHDHQLEELEPRLTDLFGTHMAFDALTSTLPQDVQDNTVFMLSGEFGRQIRANGDGGTDHGEGNIALLFGNSVRGGIYGDMFPQSELTRLADESPDVEGLTSFEHIFGAACEWAQAGAADAVFPFMQDTPLEAGLNLESLFT